MAISRCCLAKTAKECSKIYNARAQLLFCSFNFLLTDVSVPVGRPFLTKLASRDYLDFFPGLIFLTLFFFFGSFHLQQDNVCTYCVWQRNFAEEKKENAPTCLRVAFLNRDQVVPKLLLTRP